MREKNVDKYNSYDLSYFPINNSETQIRLGQKMPEAIINSIIVIISAAGILISLLLTVLLGRLRSPGLIMT